MIIRRSWIQILLISSLVQIIVVTIYPFDFTWEATRSGWDLLSSFQPTTHIKDYIRNILLFIPWGIGITGMVNQPRKTPWYVLGWSFLLSVLFSSSIELTQLLLPSRVSSYADIVCNSLGGVIGSYIGDRRQDFRQLNLVVWQRKFKLLDLKFLITIIMFYSTAIACGYSILLTNINFNNWNEKAYLAIASEVTGQLDWRGYIQSLDICDRQLQSSEITAAFADPDRFFAEVPSLVTAFKFLPLKSFYDDTAELVPNLLWNKELLPNQVLPSQPELDSIQNQNLANPNQPILFSNYNSLISSYPATQLNQKLQASQAFSLSIILATDVAEQFGPARIMSLGENIYSRNLMLAQHSTRLFFRLRTPTTGNNATQPGFYLPDFFADSQLHHLLITFGDRQLDFYLDRPDWHYHFSFEPATQFKLYFPWKFKSWEINLQDYNLLRARVIFYTLVLSPLAIAIGLFIKGWIARN